MASVTVRYFAGAARAAGRESEQLEATSVEDLREMLAARPELASVCRSASFLIDGQAAGENARLHDGATVDVLPPFAGG